MSRNRPMQSEAERFKADAHKHYERCMVDSPEMLEYKKRPDLTIDEIAELRCKPLACRVQICMTLPKEKKTHRDVFTGEYYSLDDPCENAHGNFVDCIEKEKQNILSSQGN
ncbi:hypothetical protein SteCoe_588 [Stentor coeruleus]|uniref:Uncharacterized protein n=1 Tax=Stentor coeruleus TaxID=5963 RepID=A0A1R2D3S6_9CILI|nr:hypothetical protein SteCoe_588 [Stentor coeruleus]